MPADARRRTDLIPRVAALVAFAVIAYLPALGAPFVFDDIPNLVLNDRVQPARLAELPRSLDARGDSAARPVAMVTFAANYLVGGLDPFGYHVVNLAIHVLNALLVFGVVAGLARAPFSPPAVQRHALEIAFASALLWAVHPVNTQAVTYIVQRMAALSGIPRPTWASLESGDANPTLAVLTRAAAEKPGPAKAAEKGAPAAAALPRVRSVADRSPTRAIVRRTDDEANATDSKRWRSESARVMGFPGGKPKRTNAVGSAS